MATLGFGAGACPARIETITSAKTAANITRETKVRKVLLACISTPRLREATHVPMVAKENTSLTTVTNVNPRQSPHIVCYVTHSKRFESRFVVRRFGVVLSRILAFRLLAAFAACPSETTFCHLTRECGKRRNPFRFKLLRSRYLFFGVPPQSFALFLPITERAAHVVNHNFVRRETARVIFNWDTTRHPVRS